MSEQDPRDTGGTGRGSIHREAVEFDLKKIDKSEIEALRNQLRQMVQRGDFRAVKADQLVASHSSHGDDDGWI